MRGIQNIWQIHWHIVLGGNLKRAIRRPKRKYYEHTDFGTGKCFDKKKAIRYFKERKINYQSINMKAKGLSKEAYQSVKQVAAGVRPEVWCAWKQSEAYFAEYIYCSLNFSIA